jgi:hypothetical protein
MVEEIGVDGAKHRLQVTKIKTKKTKPYRAHLVMSMMIDIGFFFCLNRHNPNVQSLIVMKKKIIIKGETFGK